MTSRSCQGQFGDLKVNISIDFLIFVINSLLLVILFLNVSNKLWPFECTQGIVSHSENNLRHRCFWDCCLALPSPWNPPYPNWTVPLPKIHQNSQKFTFWSKSAISKSVKNHLKCFYCRFSTENALGTPVKFTENRKMAIFLQFLDFLVDLSFLRIPTVI